MIAVAFDIGDLTVFHMNIDATAASAHVTGGFAYLVGHGRRGINLYLFRFWHLVLSLAFGLRVRRGGEAIAPVKLFDLSVLNPTSLCAGGVGPDKIGNKSSFLVHLAHILFFANFHQNKPRSFLPIMGKMILFERD
ncbi:hypothetical protein [Aliiroseovarius crassostreae]|uniref:hypothetical protein n=1 Tax=Aliiroseovarius crassostreae TaxID=154981 RepID=UPI003C7BCD79